MNKPEQHLQEWYAIWLKSQGALFCASAGGMRVNMRTAINMKKAGYQKGFPDMIIFLTNSEYHGMLVELKCGTYPTKAQKEWQRNLTKAGYYAIIVPANLSYQEATKFLETETEWYMSLE